LKGAQELSANSFASVYLKNNGNGKFEMTALPQAAQYSVINGMEVDDFDGDGNLDILINANDFGTEVTIGKYDALNGLVMKGNGKGGFKPLSILESGIFIPGNGKAAVKLSNKAGDYLIAASQNRGPLKLYQLKGNAKLIPVFPNETNAVIEYKNGSKRKQEFYFGSSFLSQSARTVLKDQNVKMITIKDSKGGSRVIM